MKKLNYSIGLDIGTNSVGFVCMREDFSILKYRGKYALGVHEFEAGQTAEQRRLNRGQRRRYNRRVRRIQLLQEVWKAMFSNEELVANKKINFFSEVFTDKPWKDTNDFEHRSLSEVQRLLGINQLYPTIYHLRADLVKSNEKKHPWLIYLAIHNLVKYRGHFLNGNQSWIKTSNQKPSIKAKLEHLLTLHFHINNSQDVVSEDKLKTIEILLLDLTLKRSEKKERIQQILNNKNILSCFEMLLNLSTNYKKLFYNSEQVELYQSSKNFLISNDDVLETLDGLTEQEEEFMNLALTIYQDIQLHQIIGDFDCISESKVAQYEVFRTQLKRLKEIINEFGSEELYRKLFITSKPNLLEYNKTRDIDKLCYFDRYIKHSNTTEPMKNLPKEVEKQKKDTKSLFFYHLKVILSDIKEQHHNHPISEEIETILTLIDEESYLEKIVGKHNAAIPVQNSIYEIEQILMNQSKHYPQITTEHIQNIIKLVSYRIPYFVGPLIKEKFNKDGELIEARFGWLKRQHFDERVTPWNAHNVIDEMNTATAFIERLTSYCTYLPNQKVIPKQSLLYQEYELLSELNSIQIRRETDAKHKQYRLDKEVKQWIVDHVFRNPQYQNKKIKHKDVLEALKASPYRDSYYDNSNESFKIFGTSKPNEFTATQSSFLKIVETFGIYNEQLEPMYEEIILTLNTLEDEKIARKKLSHILLSYNQSLDYVDRLIQWKVKGWGKFSRTFIDGIPVYSNGSTTVIEEMRNKPIILMELLSNQYDLSTIINKRNMQQHQKVTKLSYQDVASLSGSPAIKRGIWRALKIVEELVSIFGEPTHIMIEMARGEDIKKRTKSREDLYNELLKNIDKSLSDIKQLMQDAKNKISTNKYKEDMYWLYLLQGGKCMYTLEAINIERIHEECEIDHILPRSIVKDDSFDNRVLVKKSANQRKGDSHTPLSMASTTLISELKTYWKKLFDSHFISRRKFDLLMQPNVIEDRQVHNFIARQLVETRQITKHVKNVLENRFTETEVHLVKASIVSKFREHVKLPKIRESYHKVYKEDNRLVKLDINNKHHALDAFLCVAIIQSIIQKYGSNLLEFNFTHKGLDKQMVAAIRNSKEFTLFSNFDALVMPKHSSIGIQSAREYIYEVAYDLPWQSTFASGSSTSAFYLETIYSPRKSPNFNPSESIQSQMHLSRKGYENLFSILIETEKIKNKKRNVYTELVNAKVISFYEFRKLYPNFNLRTETDMQKLVDYLNEIGEITAKNPRFKKIIQKNQKLLFKGEPGYFVSPTELTNAKPLILTRPLTEQLAKLFGMNETVGIDDIEWGKTIYRDLVDCIIEQHGHLVSPKNYDKARNYVDDAESIKEIVYAAVEILKISTLGPTRSDKFGSRWNVSSLASHMSLVNESITGLYYRK